MRGLFKLRFNGSTVLRDVISIPERSTCAPLVAPCGRSARAPVVAPSRTVSSQSAATVTCGTGSAVQLAYKVIERGNDVSSQPPLVLHHGLLGRKENWNKTGKALSHLTKRNIILPDARNHGNSPSTHEMTYKLMSEDLLRLLQSLNIQKTSFLGHGTGGRIGMYAALTRPEMFDKLIFVTSSPLNPSWGLDLYETVRQACYVIQTLASRTSSSASKELLTSMEFKMQADQALKLVLPEVKERALFVSNLGHVNHTAILENPTLWRFPDMESYCFNKPTLFLSGDNVQSAWRTDDEVRKIRQLFPNSHFVKLPGSGIFPQLDAHEQLLEAVLTFLETEQD